jgi:hypothetical protein
VVSADMLNWMCHPNGATRFATGSSISMVVAPGFARLKRTPRTPAALSRFNSSSVTAVLTTATPRAVGPQSCNASRRPSLKTP